MVWTNTKRVVAGAAVAVLLMVLFPPWRTGNKDSGYAPLFAPPSNGYGHIDLTRLGVQVFAVAVAAGAGVTLMNRKPA